MVGHHEPVVVRVAVALVAAVLLLVPSSDAAPDGDGDVEVRPEVRAVEILRAWDQRRASAYASGDPPRLRVLYSRGSWAGARDVRTLQAYAARGLVVEDVSVQVRRVRLLSESSRLLRVQVVDRVSATVAGPGGPAVLPSRWQDRIVTMVRDANGWQVRAVRRR